ncbi:putative ribonuclease H-like domain-containing protein [Tanacetum coccineum]
MGTIQYREDSNEVVFAVVAVEKIYTHESLTFNNTVACEMVSKWKAGLKDDMDTRSDVYVLNNGCRKCSDDSDGYYWESTPGIRVGSLSRDCDVEKNGKWLCIYGVGSHEYQMVCTRLDIASADVGMLDKFDRGLQTNVQVFVDFDYAMAAHMTLTGAWKKEIWLKGLLAELGYELSLVAVIATGALGDRILQVVSNSKVFRLFNSRTRIVEENLHVQFSENTPNIEGSGTNWHFDIDALTKSMNYKPVAAGNQYIGNACTKACNDGQVKSYEWRYKTGKDYILLPMWHADPLFSQDSKSSPDAGFKPSEEEEKKDAEDLGNKDSEVSSTEDPRVNQKKDDNKLMLLIQNQAIEFLMIKKYAWNLETMVYSDDDEHVDADGLTMEQFRCIYALSSYSNTRYHKFNPVELNYWRLAFSTSNKKNDKEFGKKHGLFSLVQQRINHKDFQNYLFACFLSQEEPKKVIHALKDPRLLGLNSVYMNKKDERGIYDKDNRQDWLTRVHTKKKGLNHDREGIDYDEVFSPVARIEAIRLFLAYASFKDFVVYQMDVKSAFLYGNIEEELYVCQPPGFEDPYFPDRVSEMKDRQDFVYQKGQSQDKYVTEILKKFGFIDVKTASTPMETQKPLFKDEDGEEVDVHLYRSMIGLLMYLTSLRPNIMFAVCACARYQVNPKVSHLHAVKRIFSCCCLFLHALLILEFGAVVHCLYRLCHLAI